MRRPSSPRIGEPIALLGDALIAFVLFASADPSLRNHGSLEPTQVLGALLASLPVIARRWFPIPVLIAVELGVVVHVLLVENFLRANGLAVAVALYTVASIYERRVSLRIALAVGVLNTLLVVLSPHVVFGETGGNLIFDGVLVAGSWALGDNIRTRRALYASLVERARRLEREREERAERAVAEERARIARELHDVVAHHVSAIAVQAGAAEEQVHRDPARATEVLRNIQAASRAALNEMRAIVGVLGAGDGAELQPHAGLDELGTLVQRSRAAGLDVDLVVEGSPRALPEALDLFAYRIVQEAITNVRRHAPQAHAVVRVRHRQDTLELEISDDGRGSHPSTGDGGGRGLVGMRERVSLFHGTLEAGPSGAGFRVRAVLPVPATTAAP